MTRSVLTVCTLTVLLASNAFAQIAGPSPRIDWSGAFLNSFTLVGVEHGVRLTTPKTRRELGGHFWRDYRKSVQVPATWEDGDTWIVNYLGHPIHGAAAGFVWAANDPVSRNATFGLNSHYWATRWRPLVASAVYSAQFEIGPISEASIGNVGLDPTTTGWVDYVVTPVAGMGIGIAEDALDKFFLEWFERHATNRTARAVLRMLFNPSRSMANVASNHLPWYRAGRPLTAR
jgi:hypothetical protein